MIEMISPKRIQMNQQNIQESAPKKQKISHEKTVASILMERKLKTFDSKEIIALFSDKKFDELSMVVKNRLNLRSVQQVIVNCKNTLLITFIFTNIFGNPRNIAYFKKMTENLDESAKKLINDRLKSYEKGNLKVYEDINSSNSKLKAENLKQTEKLPLEISEEDRSNFFNFLKRKTALPENPKNICTFYRLAYSNGLSFFDLPPSYLSDTPDKKMQALFQWISANDKTLREKVWTDFQKLANDKEFPLEQISEAIISLNPPSPLVENLINLIINQKAWKVIDYILNHQKFMQSFSIYKMFLASLYKQEGFNNFKLILSNNEVLYVYLSILAASSAYFKNDSFQQMKEKSTGELDLSSEKANIIKAVIAFCYGFSIKFGDSRNTEQGKKEFSLFLYELTKAAEHFKIPSLKNKIVDFIYKDTETNDSFNYPDALPILLTNLLEIAIARKDIGLFNDFLLCAREQKVDWRELIECRNMIKQSLEFQNCKIIPFLFMAWVNLPWEDFMLIGLFYNYGVLKQ